MFAGCAANHPPSVTPPAANDWTSEYAGKGHVRATITNGSGASLFLKVVAGEATAAQAKIEGQGSRTLLLDPGSYSTKMMLYHSKGGSGPSYYRGPGFNIPPNAASLQLRLESASSTNLVPISKEQFER